MTSPDHVPHQIRELEERLGESDERLHALGARHDASLERAKLDRIEAQRQHASELERVRDARDNAMRQAESLQCELETARADAMRAATGAQYGARSDAVVHDLERELRELRQELAWQKASADKAMAAGGAVTGAVTGAGGSGSTGMDLATADLARVTAELENTKEELRKAQEEQLGAALRARRKEKELREQLKKQGA